jgi:hypothetical protein
MEIALAVAAVIVNMTGSRTAHRYYVTLIGAKSRGRHHED